MKYALFFLLVLAAAYAYREVFTRKDRRYLRRSLGDLVVPAAIASVAVVGLIFFNLNFNGKLI